MTTHQSDRIAQLERALRDSEALRVGLFESSPDCVKVLDLDGRLHEMNGPGLCLMEIDDFSPMVGEEWVKFWEGDGRLRAGEALNRARSGQVGHFEGFCRTAKGTPKWWDVLVSAVNGPDNQPKQLLVVSRDITGRKEAEERERALLEERHAREAAEQLVEERDRFLSVAAHELKTPVTTVQGYSDLFARSLEKGPTPEQLARYASALSRGATRLTSLTRDLLEVARLKEPKLTYKMEPCEMSELVRKSAESVLDLVNTTHNIVVNAEEIHVFGDCDRLEQTFMNLIDNAVKYSPEGGVVTISVTGENDDVVITFKDQGIGLPVGTAERVFAPFSRAANAERSGINGFGLGLYICRQIIEAHSGTIAASSDGEGQGTMFTIRLPRHYL